MKVLARLVCAVRGHVDGKGVLRPLWIGEGVELPAVHADYRCERCERTTTTWLPLPPGLPPPTRTMLLADWLREIDFVR